MISVPVYYILIAFLRSDRLLAFLVVDLFQAWKSIISLQYILPFSCTELNSQSASEYSSKFPKIHG